ncbi:MAG: hypothetical protein JRI97_09610 [Deltaproteobacteria bacterium]|nr:hypothetical protein [Deltaproteobacteria bacterium]
MKNFVEQNIFNMLEVLMVNWWMMEKFAFGGIFHPSGSSDSCPGNVHRGSEYEEYAFAPRALPGQESGVVNNPG